jgi:CHAT domain-containing protein
LDGELARAQSRLESDPAPKGTRGGLNRQVARLLKEREAMSSTLARQDPGQAVLLGAAAPDPWSGLQTLAPNELALEYFAVDDHLHLFVLEREGVVSHHELTRSDQLRDRLDLLSFQLGKGALGAAHAEVNDRFIHRSLSNHLEHLHEELLGPVAADIQGRALRIVPHGLLHGLPFHALEAGGRPLIDCCDISYAPSLAVLGLLGRRDRGRRSRPLVLGVPDASAPAIEAEVAALEQRLGKARVFRGSQATARALRRSEDHPSVLHVACHGFYSEGSSMVGGLRMGDVWVSLPDIYRMQGTGELVVLSGCETGRGTVHSGDEWVGLVRGFLQAGARAVVSSLWEVHDESTLTLMDDFYRELAIGTPVASALAKAQRRLRRERPNPLFWAPFVTIGDAALRLRVSKAA